MVILPYTSSMRRAAAHGPPFAHEQGNVHGLPRRVKKDTGWPSTCARAYSSPDLTYYMGHAG